MSLPTQSKILRVLQEGEFERLGGTETIKVDARLLAATHKDLQMMIDEGTFRQDLYFRLSVVPIRLPSLWERATDIPDFANHFLQHFAAKNRKDIKGYPPEALRLLMQYSWPGNIRELENTVERAVILCPGELSNPGNCRRSCYRKLKRTYNLIRRLVKVLPFEIKEHNLSSRSKRIGKGLQ